VAAIDPLKMSTVMRNLLSNAIKFSRPGGTIYVRLAVLGAEARRQSVAVARSQSIAPTPASMRVSTGVMKKYDVVEISVKDDGAGLSKENIGRLFQEGVQINPNKLQKGGGSGFGLYITKGIVELHGGSIWAESEGEGHGATFVVQLPLCTEPPSPSADSGTMLDQLDDLESIHSSHRDTHSAVGATFQVRAFLTCLLG
jgi:signal transduction histidine kinase